MINDSLFPAIRHPPVESRERAIEPALLLYTTSSCHLCEQAEALLQSAGASVEMVEIADSEELLERYGVRIPVLRHRETGEEPDWPFDAAAILRLLTTYQFLITGQIG